MIHSRSFLVSVAASILIILATLTVFWTRKPAPPPPEPLVVAVAANLIGMPFFIAEQQGFFADEGLQVTLQRYPFGKLALEAMLRGEAEARQVPGEIGEGGFGEGLLGGGLDGVARVAGGEGAEVDLIDDRGREPRGV